MTRVPRSTSPKYDESGCHLSGFFAWENILPTTATDTKLQTIQFMFSFNCRASSLRPDTRSEPRLQIRQLVPMQGEEEDLEASRRGGQVAGPHRGGQRGLARESCHCRDQMGGHASLGKLPTSIYRRAHLSLSSPPVLFGSRSLWFGNLLIWFIWSCFINAAV
jgi:hypothetical protein